MMDYGYYNMDCMDVGFEKDMGMYQKSRKRLEDFKSQMTLRDFGIEEEPNEKQ